MYSRNTFPRQEKNVFLLRVTLLPDFRIYVLKKTENWTKNDAVSHERAEEINGYLLFLRKGKEFRKFHRIMKAASYLKRSLADVQLSLSLRASLFKWKNTLGTTSAKTRAQADANTKHWKVEIGIKDLERSLTTKMITHYQIRSLAWKAKKINDHRARKETRGTKINSNLHSELLENDRKTISEHSGRRVT